MSPDQQTLMATECATCGGPLPYSGVGRPRKFCDDCRPAWFPPLKEVNRPVSGDVRGMVRRTDPDTSIIAARIASLTAGTMRGKCLLALADAGDRGLTDHELGAKVGRQQTSAGKRRLELQECGYVENTHEKRPTPSRAVASVWRITEAGIAKAQELRG